MKYYAEIAVIEELQARNAELLEALRQIENLHLPRGTVNDARLIARIAIAKFEGR